MSEKRQPKYKVGDIVKLNAGGPDMTILRRIVRTPLAGDPYFSGLYQCQWFAGKKLDSGEFQEAGLILVKSQSEANES